VLNYIPMKISLSSLIRIAVSIILILLLLYVMRDKYGQILAVLKGTNISSFVLGFLVYMVAVMLASARLRLIAMAQSISMTFKEAASFTYIGYFFNNFLPTSIGGDVVKAHYLSKRCAGKTGAYTSVFIDRAIGLMTMIFMAFVALLFAESSIIDARLKYMIYAITALSALGVVFMLSEGFAKRFSVLLSMLKPIEGHLKKVYRAINSYRHHAVLMTQTLVLSVASQLLFFASMGILARSIDSYISPMDLLLRMPIISVMSLLPSINGLGLREGATVLLFGSLIGKANAFAVSILVIVMLLMTSLIGGLTYALSPQFKVKIRELDKEAAI
jgi:glycosyltransferase 2 family protein